MAFESIICPECRATEGFTQVEFDTYYCPYHKGLFKWVDGNRITLRRVGHFCPCGNRVESQCQLCGSDLCTECDALESHRRLRDLNDGTIEGRREEYETFGHIIVPAQGFGYLEYVDFRKIWMITGGRIKIVRISDPVIGPFLSLSDIWPQLGADPDSLAHVCCECVGAKIPLTAEAIATGTICEHPGCGVGPTERCRCCGNAFCTRHFIDNISPARREPELIVAHSPEAWRFQAPSQVGLCAMCGDECRKVAREEVNAVLATHPFGWILGPERKVNKMIDEFDRTPRPCTRNRIFDEEVASSQDYPPGRTKSRRANVSLRRRDFLISTYKRLAET